VKSFLTDNRGVARGCWRTYLRVRTDVHPAGPDRTAPGVRPVCLL